MVEKKKVNVVIYLQSGSVLEGIHATELGSLVEIASELGSMRHTGGTPMIILRRKIEPNKGAVFALTKNVEAFEIYS